MNFYRPGPFLMSTSDFQLLSEKDEGATGIGTCQAERSLNRAHTNGGVQQRTLLRRVLRRVLEIAFEKVLRRVLRRCLAVGLMGRRVLRRVLRRGSKKGLSRRHLEGRSTPSREYDPLGVCPTQRVFERPPRDL